MDTYTFEKERHTFRSAEFRSVVEEAVKFFGDTPIHALPPHKSVSGLGVYGLYYLGDFDLYRPLGLANRNSDNPNIPIYIGKAVPVGSRTGRNIDVEDQGKSVRSRLAEHARSISAAESYALENGVENIRLSDFACRFMILENYEADLIVPVESELIRTYRPLWNSVVSGLGIHAPGGGRLGQAASEWDVIHPGRYFARGLTGTATLAEHVVKRVNLALATHLPSEQ